MLREKILVNRRLKVFQSVTYRHPHYSFHSPIHHLKKHCHNVQCSFGFLFLSHPHMVYYKLTMYPMLRIQEDLRSLNQKSVRSVSINYLQAPSLQFLFSDSSFEETLSQYAVQLRLLDLFPSPHVALQVDQVPHAENSGGPYINFEYFSTILK